MTLSRRLGRRHLEFDGASVAGAVSSGVIVEPTVVILPSAVWLAEVQSELERLGVHPDLAPHSARHIIHRVVGHAGYRQAFMYDPDDERDVSEVGGTEHRAEVAP